MVRAGHGDKVTQITSPSHVLDSATSTETRASLIAYFNSLVHTQCTPTLRYTLPRRRRPFLGFSDYCACIKNFDPKFLVKAHQVLYTHTYRNSSTTRPSESDSWSTLSDNRWCPVIEEALYCAQYTGSSCLSSSLYVSLGCIEIAAHPSPIQGGDTPIFAVVTAATVLIGTSWPSILRKGWSTLLGQGRMCAQSNGKRSTQCR